MVVIASSKDCLQIKASIGIDFFVVESEFAADFLAVRLPGAMAGARRGIG